MQFNLIFYVDKIKKVQGLKYNNISNKKINADYQLN